MTAAPTMSAWRMYQRRMRGCVAKVVSTTTKEALHQLLTSGNATSAERCTQIHKWLLTVASDTFGRPPSGGLPLVSLFFCAFFRKGTIFFAKN